VLCRDNPKLNTAALGAELLAINKTPHTQNAAENQKAQSVCDSSLIALYIM
jgi:hypothetical protein